MIPDHNQVEMLFGLLLRGGWGWLKGLICDLNSLLNHVDGLDELIKPFENDEMDLIVKNMPIDKALGPDGFNGLLFKKCWPIICKEFYALA